LPGPFIIVEVEAEMDQEREASQPIAESATPGDVVPKERGNALASPPEATTDWRQRCEALEKECDRLRSDLNEVFACNRRLIEAHRAELQANDRLIAAYEAERQHRLEMDAERPFRKWLLNPTAKKMN
jgi:hypothetical protein